jgi:surface protein
MFSNCQSFNADVSQWNIANAINLLRYMFSGCSSFNETVVAGWPISLETRQLLFADVPSPDFADVPSPEEEDDDDDDATIKQSTRECFSFSCIPLPSTTLFFSSSRNLSCTVFIFAIEIAVTGGMDHIPVQSLPGQVTENIQRFRVFFGNLGRRFRQWDALRAGIVHAGHLDTIRAVPECAHIA